MGLESEIRSKFEGKVVVVVGDAVADQFLSGTISRVSREAPVFILRHDATETRPGGAANAAANIAALGGDPLLIGLVGADASGTALCNAIEKSDVATENLITASSFETTTKIRVIGGQPYAAKKQMIRIDHENRQPIEPDLRIQMLTSLAFAAENADAIVLSDYNYGVIDSELIRTARDLSQKHSIPLIVDSRFRLREFAEATAATPNQEEVEALIGRQFNTKDCEDVRIMLGLRALLVTLGGRGMVLAEAGKPPLEIPVIGSDQPVDVTGAGDTVIAAFSLGLSSGLDLSDAAKAANHAGGIVVMKKGTAVVTIDELEASLTRYQTSFSFASNEN